MMNTLEKLWQVDDNEGLERLWQVDDNGGWKNSDMGKKNTLPAYSLKLVEND